MYKTPFLLLLSFAACSQVQQMQQMLHCTTDAILENRHAVLLSTQVIEENQRVVEQSNRTIKENKELLHLQNQGE